MYICFLLNLEDCRVEKSVIVEAVEDFNYLKNFEEADDKELFCLDIDEYENNRLFYDERDEIVTEEQLENSYKELKASGEFAGTFEAYIKDCCSKNGTLTEITKGENKMTIHQEADIIVGAPDVYGGANCDTFHIEYRKENFVVRYYGGYGRKHVYIVRWLDQVVVINARTENGAVAKAYDFLKKEGFFK